MTPVLFLDFDGPLFPENQILVDPGMHMYPGKLKLHNFASYWKMSSTSVDMLNALYDIYMFDTVVSSTWQDYHDKEQIEDLFAANGLNLVLHNDWNTKCDISNPFKSYRGRGSEIVDWLRNHNRLVKFIEEGDKEFLEYPAHIILDDPWSGEDLFEWKQYKILSEPCIIDPNVGIDPEVFKCMRGTVRSWSDDYESRTVRFTI